MAGGQKNEVIYNVSPFVLLDKNYIEQLKKQALQNERRRCRLCIHRHESDLLHEMLIVHTNETYVRPHKHLTRAESFHVLEGRCSIVVFDDSGKMTSIEHLGTLSSGLPFFYKLSDHAYHTTLIHSDILVFQETTQGPFKREDTEFPSWAPDGEDADETALYLAELHAAVRRRVPVD